jgi:hypothetical protein
LTDHDSCRLFKPLREYLYRGQGAYARGSGIGFQGKEKKIEDKNEKNGKEKRSAFSYLLQMIPIGDSPMPDNAVSNTPCGAG